MTSQKFKRPPLLEVRCEVVLTGGEWTDDTPFHLRAHLSEGFPRQVNTGPGETKARVIMSRHHDSQAVQFFPDKVVVSQLRPYPGFDTWRSLVLDMVALHNDVLGSKKIEKIIVRYVNRIALPERHADVSRYLNVEAGRINGFRRRIRLEPRHASHRLRATIGSGHGSHGEPEVALLDIFDSVDAGDCGDVGNIGKCLDEAHENVQKAFTHLVKPDTRRTFEETRPEA